MPYFSDREKGHRLRTNEQIGSNAWNAIEALINALINDGSLGYRYPQMCGSHTCGCNLEDLNSAIRGIVPALNWSPFRSRALDTWTRNPSAQIPNTYDILDLLEFLYKNIAKPIGKNPHQNFLDEVDHYHLDYDPELGKQDFINRINDILERNNISFQLNPKGLVERVTPEILGTQLISAIFNTGNEQLDNYLNRAREKYLHPARDIHERKEAIKELWDAWQCLKSLDYPKDTKTSIENTLGYVAPKDSQLWIVLNNEATALSKIGDNFDIRHTEVNKEILRNSAILDYLFHRMFALIYLCLETTNRIGKIDTP